MRGGSASVAPRDKIVPKIGFSDLYGCLLCPPATIEEMDIAAKAVEIAAQHGMRGADIRVGAILALRLREERLADMNAVGPEATK